MKLMEMAKLRAWWAHRQGLDGSLAGLDSGAVLARTGWARSVGGSNPYLTLFARGGLTRETVDRDVAEVRICELPSARGCTYVLPAEDFGLGLAAAKPYVVNGDMATGAKLGVTPDEIERLCDGIAAVLGGVPLDPKEIKTAVGSLVRDLGPEGVKRGLATTFPLAMRLLQWSGRARRVAVNGRLDTQRYGYVRWSPAPSYDGRSPMTDLARRYFQWIGPASVAHFRWFSGLGVAAAKDALAPLNLVDVGCGLLLLEEDREAFDRYVRPSEPSFALVSSLDGILLLRRDLSALVEVEDEGQPMIGEKGLQTIGGIQELANNPILHRGRVVGIWEFDPSSGTIVWHSWVDGGGALSVAIEHMETFIRNELGDARSFSLDSPSSRRPVIEAIRTLR